MLRDLFTKYSTQLVIGLVAILVFMRVGLALARPHTALARFIVWFWHPDARAAKPSERLDDRIYPMTIQNMDHTLLALMLVFFVIRPGVIQAFYIPSGSMYPTLSGSETGRQDRVLVNKYVFALREPQRGEIVVFNAPSGALMPGATDKAFIKRLIGLPGDVIEVKNHHAFVNGQRLEEPYLNELTYSRPFLGDFGPVTVPPDHYFMMGDNRENSHDSRVWDETFLPAENVLGKAMCVFWPLNAVKLLD